MIEAITAFLIAFFFSYIGTIPPGTLNLTIIQMGLEHRERIAWRFASAGALIEYFYAWIAVEFEALITSSTTITDNFELITAVVMISLGIASLWTIKKPSKLQTKFSESGFRRGIVLGILNPMALPFWIAMTAYIRSQKWTDLSTNFELHAYLFGVALGGLALMMCFFYLARKVVSYLEGNSVFKRIPGITLLILGSYALIKYFV